MTAAAGRQRRGGSGGNGGGEFTATNDTRIMSLRFLSSTKVSELEIEDRLAASISNNFSIVTSDVDLHYACAHKADGYVRRSYKGQVHVL